jgi:hypothetical protein
MLFVGPGDSAMSIPATLPQTEPAGNPVPPLENGDHLDSDEFERRYGAMPDLKHAELLEGEVYVGPPVRAHFHGRPHSELMTW